MVINNTDIEAFLEMNMSNYDKVREFHKAFGAALDQPLDKNTLQLRGKLILEEFNEVMDEIFEDGTTVVKDISEIDRKALLKELCDVLVVVYGTAASFGFEIDEAFRRVHESNMSKLGADGKPIYREDGKVLKGEGYKKPDLTGLA